MSAERHHDEGLPLLRWSPPSTTLLPFPTHRREDFVLRNAERMIRMKQERAMQHLCCTLASLEDRLHRLGLAAHMIESDVAAARVAVLTKYAAMGGGRRS